MAACDTIFIRQLLLQARIGAYEWEKDILQKLCLDVDIQLDLSAAAAADDLALTVDYAALAEQIQAWVLAEPAVLVEAMAERIAQGILRDRRVQQVRIGLTKPHALLMAQGVGVEITRSAATAG